MTLAYFSVCLRRSLVTQASSEASACVGDRLIPHAIQINISLGITTYYYKLFSLILHFECARHSEIRHAPCLALLSTVSEPVSAPIRLIESIIPSTLHWLRAVSTSGRSDERLGPFNPSALMLVDVLRINVSHPPSSLATHQHLYEDGPRRAGPLILIK